MSNDVDPAMVELAHQLKARVDHALRQPTNDRLWLGLGLEDVPGKPFQWAWNRERAAIFAHVKAKMRHDWDHAGARRQWATHRGMGIDFYVTKIQARLHRRHPSYKERHAAWKASLPGARPDTRFTDDELKHLIDLFDGANNPVNRSIAEKAWRQLDARDAAAAQRK